jgi:hypothetical protein
LRSLTGSQPPDEEARKGHEAERQERPSVPPAAVKGQRDPDRDHEQDRAEYRDPALGALGRSAALPLVGHEEERGDVGDDAGAAEEDQRDGGDPHDDGVDGEVLGDAGADAADDAVAARSVEAARCGLRGGRLRGGLLLRRPLGAGLLLLGGRLLRSGLRLLGSRVVLVGRGVLVHTR